MTRRLGFVLLAILLAAAVGCARWINIVVEERSFDPGARFAAPSLSGPVPAGPLTTVSGESQVVSEPMAASPSSDPVQAGGAVDDGALHDVYFDYDSWRLTEASAQTLLRNADWLRAHPNHSLLIEGHCDQRGTLAYNLVLGEKRARAVRNYLVNLDIPTSRITAVSYGKERPFCEQADEQCYRENRRGHLVVKTMMSQVP